jgi:hypothetical protein
MNDIEKRLKQACAEVERLQKLQIQARLEEQELEDASLKPLAEQAHNLLCTYNHTDGCGWGYEETSKDKWSCYSHNDWLQKVRRIVSEKRCTVTELAEILKAYAVFKKVHPNAPWVIRLLR